MFIVPWIALIITLIAADQASKLIMAAIIRSTGEIEVITGFFYLIHVENTGAAWSILKNGRYFFIVTSIILIVLLVYVLVRIRHALPRLSLSIITAGAIGNLIDRIYKGSVTDFFDFNIFGYHFPTFNIADMSIFFGTILLFLLLIRKHPDFSELFR